MRISARNHLRAKILEVKMGAATSHVRIDMGDGAIGAIVTASIPNEAVAELDLKTGDIAWAIIKASDVLIGK